MPKLSSGLEYFDIQTNIMDDKRIKLLRAEFGIKGFGIWVELLRQIYADEGYFLEWDKDTQLLFANDVGESGGLVDEVVKGSVKRGLFNETVFNQFNVLTSKHIQEKYFKAIKRRSTALEIIEEYLVIDRDAYIKDLNVDIKSLYVNISAQRREEKSKEEKSKEDIYPFDSFWDDYDKKRDRAKCEKKWKKVSDQDKELIRDFIPIYKAFEPDEEYRKNPLTFLNGKTWKDNWDSYPPKQNKNNQTRNGQATENKPSNARRRRSITEELNAN